MASRAFDSNSSRLAGIRRSFESPFGKPWDENSGLPLGKSSGDPPDGNSNGTRHYLPAMIKFLVNKNRELSRAGRRQLVRRFQLLDRLIVVPVSATKYARTALSGQET